MITYQRQTIRQNCIVACGGMLASQRFFVLFLHSFGDFQAWRMEPFKILDKVYCCVQDSSGGLSDYWLWLYVLVYLLYSNKFVRSLHIFKDHTTGRKA